MGALKKLAGETAIYGMSSIVGRFINWWLVPYHSRIFLPEEYGVVTNLYSYIAFLLVILTFGMETGFFRFANKSKDENEKIYSTSAISLFGSSLLFIVVGFLFSGSFAGFLDYPNAKDYVQWLVVIVALDAATSIPFAHLRMKGKAVRFASLKLVNIFFNIFFNLFFLSFCPYILKVSPDSFIRYIYSPEVGVGYVFIANLLASVITLVMLIPEIRKIKPVFDWALFREMFWYSFPILLVGIAGMINQNIDKILIPELVPAHQKPMEQLGIYGANYKLAVLMNMFIQAFRYSFEPFFFSHQKSSDSRAIYAQVMKYFVIFGLLIFLGITLFIDIFKIVIGPEYHSGLRVVPSVLMANLFLGIYFNLSLWYKLSDKTWMGALIGGIGSVLTIGFNIWLIPVMGYMGSAYAVLVCFVLMTVISYIAGQKYYPVEYDLKRILFYFLVAIGLYYLSTMLSISSDIVKYAAAAGLFAAFLGVVFVAERKELIRIIRQ
ncbi:MAG TPA: oligosaccharide flippase family protein [Prolixibacteraceae bacterium]|nr:oligosaccharide flippase family protein [Prolixibacteraceae bacterium]